jgi:hypothetical protein
MAFKFGKTSLRDSFRSNSSAKSNDRSLSSFVAVPPERQLSPLHGQLTSFGARVSRHPLLLFAANRGEMTMVSSSAPARNVAASAERK